MDNLLIDLDVGLGHMFDIVMEDKVPMDMEIAVCHKNQHCVIRL